METEVSARDLRNHTARVLDEVEEGGTVYITRNGRRVAALTSLTGARHPANERLLRYLAATKPYDSGLADFVADTKREQIELDAERFERLFGVATGDDEES